MDIIPPFPYHGLYGNPPEPFFPSVEGDRTNRTPYILPPCGDHPPPPENERIFVWNLSILNGDIVRILNGDFRRTFETIGNINGNGINPIGLPLVVQLFFFCNAGAEMFIEISDNSNGNIILDTTLLGGNELYFDIAPNTYPDILIFCRTI